MNNTKLCALGKVVRAFDIDEVGYSSFNADGTAAVRRSSGPSQGERSVKKFFTIGQIAELLEVSTRNGVGGHQNNSTSLSMPRRCMSSLIET